MILCCQIYILKYHMNLISYVFIYLRSSNILKRISPIFLSSSPSSVSVSSSRRSSHVVVSSTLLIVPVNKIAREEGGCMQVLYSYNNLLWVGEEAPQSDQCESIKSQSFCFCSKSLIACDANRK